MAQLQSRLLDFLARIWKREPEMNDLTGRVNRAVEGILENEALTADLDDDAAKVLLDWGIACAKMIAQSAAGLNDVEAEQATSPRLRATRRLMRLVNRWVPKRQQMDAEGSATLLIEIIEQAAIIYKDFTPPGNDRRDTFLRLHFELDPLQMIAGLRQLLENSSDTSLANQGGGR